MAKRAQAQRFIDVLRQRQSDFVAIEDSGAAFMRRQLLNTKRQALNLIAQQQQAYSRSGRYLSDAPSLHAAEQTLADVNQLLGRGFGKVTSDLWSLKQDSFEHAVWDYQVASQKLPSGMQAMLGGSLQQMFPEAAHSAMTHPVMGVDPTLAFRGVHGDTMQRVQRLLTKGIMNGDSVRETAQELSQALDLTVAASERIVRTSMNAAYNDAHKQIMQANSDIFVGYRWDAVMDDRTSPICIMLHGQTWPLDETPPGPPAHWNCRSILNPVFRDPTVNDVLENDTIRVKRFGPGEDERYGWMKAKESSESWLRKQPSWVTRQITGSGLKNKLYRDGAINIKDIVGPDLRTRSDREVLRRAWAANPRNTYIGDLARARGFRTPVSMDTIAAEDRALARKQPFSQPSEDMSKIGSPSPEAATPDRLAKWKSELETTNNEATQVDEQLRLLRERSLGATGPTKEALDSQIKHAEWDRVRLRNKKWRIETKIKKAALDDPPPLPGPTPPPDPTSRVTRWENEWLATRDELAAVRLKLGLLRATAGPETIAALEKDVARLVNQRWRRWKKLPEESKARLLKGIMPPKPVVVTPKPTVTLTTAEKRAEAFKGTVQKVEDINKQIIAMRERAAVQVLNDADKVYLKNLQANRTKEMNKLRAALRQDRSLRIPDSTRLPPPPKPVKIPKPPKDTVTLDGDLATLADRLSPDVAKMQKDIEYMEGRLSKAEADYKRARLQQYATSYGTSQYQELTSLVRNLGEVRHKLRQEFQGLVKQHRLTVAAEYGKALNTVKAPKYFTDPAKAIAYAKKELAALRLTPTEIEKLGGNNMLELAARASGRATMDPKRQAIFNQIEKELTSLGQWNKERAEAFDVYLRAMNDRAVSDAQITSIRWIREVKRSYAFESGNTIGLTTDSNTSTMIHEFAHHFQFRDTALRNRMTDWQKSRVLADPKSTWFRDEKEFGWKDKFWHDYIGRNYNKWTRTDPLTAIFEEGFSMGSHSFFDTTFWHDALTHDPDHFYLTWSILRGY